MKIKRILLPIDIGDCVLEIFPFVNDLAARCNTAVTLLHVINLKILAPESRLYDELAAEAHIYLDRMAQEYLPTAVSKTTRVRFGKPAKEILKQCCEEKVDLVVLLQNDDFSLRRRLRGMWKGLSNPPSPLIERVVREANCGVLVVSSKRRLDCEATWGRLHHLPTGEQTCPTPG